MPFQAPGRGKHSRQPVWRQRGKVDPTTASLCVQAGLSPVIYDSLTSLDQPHHSRVGESGAEVHLQPGNVKTAQASTLLFSLS